MTPSSGADRRQLLRAAAATLSGPTARLDAELLLAHALGKARMAMLLDPAPVPSEVEERFETLLARRREHEPVAYILGVREFRSLDLAVSPDVLIPRPDSETLIEVAMAAFADRAPTRLLDLGTGSGALLLAALDHWRDAQGLGVDCSPAAVRVAAGNASRLGLGARARFAVGDWGLAVRARFDLILANPPYVAAGDRLPPDVACYEPALALFAGADGLAAYRRLLPMVPPLLAPRGCAVVEIGCDQAAAVLELAVAAGLAGTVHSDLGGRPRALLLR